MNKYLFIFLVLILAAIILFAGWNILSTTTEYEEGDQAYDELQSFVQMQTAPPTEPTPPPAESKPTPTGVSGETEPTESAEPPATEATEPPDDTLWPIVDFAALKEINPDIIGWVYLEGTNINYPIVQGEDNKYYLRRLYNGKKNHSGCIFMDYRCESDMSSPHTIIYGHNMNNGAMFAALTKYKRQSFYNEHPTILILTPEKNFKVEVFAAYVTTAYEDAWFLDLNSQNSEKWLNEVQENSRIQSHFQPLPGDRIFTLSTCTYDYDHARFVVHGIIH